MNVIFHPAAVQELSEAVAFYNEQIDGLGATFYEEIYESIELIRLYPDGFPFMTRRTRKCLLRKFPYMLLYGIVAGDIVISAVAHQHRHPRAYLR